MTAHAKASPPVDVREDIAAPKYSPIGASGTRRATRPSPLKA